MRSQPQLRNDKYIMKNICIGVVHVFLGCALSLVLSLFRRKGGPKLRQFMNDIHELLFLIFYISFASLRTTAKILPFKVDVYQTKSSLTDPEIFMVAFSHEKKEDSVKK